MLTDLTTAQVTLLLFPALMIWAAASNLISLKVHNGLLLLLVAGYFVLAPISGVDPAAIGHDAAIAFAVLVFGFAFFTFGWIGLGEAKLAAATALWLGAELTMSFVLYAVLFAGLMTLLIALFRRLSLPGPLAGKTWLMRLHSGEAGLPYGVPLSAAGLLMFPASGWVAGLI